MATLPQLIEEDIGELNRSLNHLLKKSEAGTAAIIDKGGFLITKTGEDADYDLTTIAALSAASFAATESIATLVGEHNFTSVYQQGDQASLIVINVDQFCLLVVIFKASISVGAVKYFATETVKQIAGQMQTAEARAPGAGFDLSELNMADATPLFTRKAG